MGRDSIIGGRKELKRSARTVLKRHYFALAFLSLIMIFFGTEFRQAAAGLDRRMAISSWAELKDRLQADGSRETGSVLDAGSIFQAIAGGSLKEGEAESAELTAELSETASSSSALGRTNGVLAQIVNKVWSGQLLVKAAQAVYAVTRSDRAVGIVFTLVSFLGVALVFIFLQKVYSAVIRRIFLQARVYEKVHVHDTLYFASVRRWTRASLTLLAANLLQVLWWLTIAGGVIKSYAYAAVPYIVAENPDIRPREAISLSQRMMDGHKLELFKLQLSLLPWQVLSAATVGFSDFFYGVPYRLACYTEFYVRVREEAFARGISGTELLNDRCLFERPTEADLAAAYPDVEAELRKIRGERIELRGIRKLAADWLGLWLGSLRQKKAFDERAEEETAIELEREELQGLAYPRRLSPLRERRRRARRGSFAFIRSYSLCTLFLFFIGFSVFGWCWEVALHYVQTGQFANRGTLTGPWLPIYGSGGVIVLMLCSRFRKHPAMEFLASVVLCGTIEYASSWYLEMRYHEEWWSYKGYFLNLNGRICAEGLLVFGIGCSVIVYLVAPLFDHFLSKMPHNALVLLSAVLLVLFAADAAHSVEHPNEAAGAVEAAADAASAGTS